MRPELELLSNSIFSIYCLNCEKKSGSYEYHSYSPLSTPCCQLNIRELLKTIYKDVPLWTQYIGKNRFL